MSDEDEIIHPATEALLDAGEQLAGVEPRIAWQGPDGNEIPVVLHEVANHEGTVAKTVAVAHDLLKAIDERAEHPRRRKGVHTLLELNSFIDYVNRYKNTETSIVYVDPMRFTASCVFDDHHAGPNVSNADWRQHIATYACPRSPEWQIWCANDQKPLTQEAFADFIEARLEDLRKEHDYPAPLDMLTMARNLLVRTKGTFERSLDPTTGNGVLTNKTENETGSTVIPRAFVLGIPVFEGGAAYRVEARIRMQVADGRASFSYTMHRRKEIERDAFGDIRREILAETKLPLLAGNQ
jgi:uncharacterized protein YfdQ (DUF2303 family)